MSTCRARIPGASRKARAQTTLKLKYVTKNDDVEAGDRLITSGKDAIFPKGLAVGIVISVNKNQAGLFSDIDVMPFNNFKKLDEVLVVKEMIRKAVCLAFGVFLMIFESSLFSFLPLELAKPDLGVPFIIYGTFFLSPAEGLLAAVLFGFTQEVLSNSPAGALLFTNVGLLLSCIFLKNRLYIESRYTFSLVCGAVGPRGVSHLSGPIPPLQGRDKERL